MRLRQVAEELKTKKNKLKKDLNIAEEQEASLFGISGTDYNEFLQFKEFQKLKNKG